MQWGLRCFSGGHGGALALQLHLAGDLPSNAFAKVGLLGAASRLGGAEGGDRGAGWEHAAAPEGASEAAQALLGEQRGLDAMRQIAADGGAVPAAREVRGEWGRRK